MALAAGHTVDGKYRILRMIGEGGMGAVYEGENVRIHRKVAIKVLHAGIASNEEAMRRFEREAQAAGHIGNDHILEVLDLGELPEGDRYMVMEFLEGEPLSERIHRLGRLTPKELAPLIRQVLVGLKAAHSSGIIHRDLKPDNIYILTEKAGQRDFVKIIDFGISKFQPTSGEMKMTRTGTVMGTPYYMSPEQASGKREADHRSDLYAVGVMMYEALSGGVPFDATTFNQLLFQIVLSEPVPIQQAVPGIDPAFATLVAKAMARDVERRFQTAEDFIAALDQWADFGHPVTIPPAAETGQYLPPGVTPGVATERIGTGTPAHGTPQDGGNGLTKMPGTAGAATPNSWAGATQTLPKKSSAGLIVAAAAIVLGLGGVGAWLGLHSRGESEPAAAASSPVPIASPLPSPNTVAAPAPAPQPVAQPTPPVEPATATTTATTTATATAGKPHAAAPATARPSTPQPAHTATPRPRPTQPSGGGSSTPDFGY